MLLESGLVHEDEIITSAVILGSGGISTPQLEPRHFLRQIQLFPPLSLDNPDCAIGRAHDEIRRIGGEVAVGFHIVELETHRQVVLGERRHVFRGFQKGSERQLKATGLRFSDGFGENGFLCREERAMLGTEGARLPQTNPGFDVRGAGILNGQRVDGGLERVIQNFADFRFG